MKSLLKFKFKLRHGIFSLYGIIAVVILLKLFNIIQISWLVLASPFLFGVFGLILYLATLLFWSFIHNKRQSKIISEMEKSFFCFSCAKPLKKPILHKKDFEPKCEKCKL